jgi:hypothetical protein
VVSTVPPDVVVPDVAVPVEAPLLDVLLPTPPLLVVELRAPVLLPAPVPPLVPADERLSTLDSSADAHPVVPAARPSRIADSERRRDRTSGLIKPDLSAIGSRIALMAMRPPKWLNS